MSRVLVLLVVLVHIFLLPNARAEEIITLKGAGGEVLCKGKIGDEWKELKVLLKNGNVIHPFSASPSTSIYFEGERESDLSKNRLYIVVNKIERGIVYAGGPSEEVEKYYCSFVEIKSGCVLKEEMGEFCGGYWSNETDKWKIAGRSVNIDKRTAERNRRNLVEYFDGFSDA